MTEQKFRPIRSFVKREGRMTRAQLQALEHLLPIYSVADTLHPINLDQLFPRHAPRLLEIGFGMGASLIQMAEEHPDRDYLGIEVHRPGVGSLLVSTHEKQLTNLKVINEDAVEVLKRAIPENSLDGVYLFFPDPWHKKKHHKRRILQPAFVEQIYRCLKREGFFHMATDWEDYARHMMDIMSAATGFTNTAGEKLYVSRNDRPETKYERRGQRLGHGVWDLIFKKQ